MNQKKQEETKSLLCNKVAKLPFVNRKQVDLVFKFASLVIRNKKVKFYVTDDTVSGSFCALAQEYIKEIEKLKSFNSIDEYIKTIEIINIQKKIEELMKESLKKIKEI